MALPGSDASKLFNTYKQKLQSGEAIRIDIIRRGKPIQLWYSMRDECLVASALGVKVT